MATRTTPLHSSFIHDDMTAINCDDALMNGLAGLDSPDNVGCGVGGHWTFSAM